MSKEKYYHRIPKNSKGILKLLQHGLDRARRPMVRGFPFAGTTEQRELFFQEHQLPPQTEEGGLVDPFANGIQHDIWLEQVRRTNNVYNESVVNKKIAD